MSNSSNKYQFVFPHLTPIVEMDNENSSRKVLKMQRNVSQAILQQQPKSSQLSETPSIQKSLSTPNLQVPNSILTGLEPKQSSFDNVVPPQKNTPILLNQLNLHSYKVQNTHQQANLAKNPMNSNQKKTYQYYFKKTPTNDSRQSWPRNGPQTKSQSYIRYEKYNKLNSSIHNSPASKDPPHIRISGSLAVEKHGSSQSANSSSGKLILQRQPSIEYKTEKLGYNFVTTALSSTGSKQPAKITVYTDRVIQTVNSGLPVKGRLQQSMTQSQVQSKQSQGSKNFHQVNLNQKSRQFQQFLNQTMGESHQSDRNIKTNGQNIQNANSIKNLSAISYLDEIQKIKTKPQHNQVQEETVLKVEQEVNLPQKQETTVQTCNDAQNCIQAMGLCLECERLHKDLEKTKSQIEQVEKKRQANMDQILRQQKTIKEMQENEPKLRKELESKQKTISSLTAQIQALTRSSTKTQPVQLSQSSTQHLESQLSQLHTSYQQQLQKSTQMISAYVSTIERQNVRIEEMEGSIAKKQGEVGLYEERIKEFRDRERSLVERHETLVREVKEQQVLVIETINKQHSAILQKLSQQYQQQITSVTTKIQSLQQTSTQIPQLTQTIQKLQSQILHDKSIMYETQKKLCTNNMQLEQLRKDRAKASDQVQHMKVVVSRMEGETQTYKNQINALTKDKILLEGLLNTQKLTNTQLKAILETRNQQLTNTKQSVSQLLIQTNQLHTEKKQLQKECRFLNCIKDLFKLYIDQQQFQNISNKVLTLLSQDKSTTEIMSLVVSSHQSLQLSAEPENTSISPSTASHPKSRKTLRQKDAQSMAHQLKSTAQQLSEVQAQYAKISEELQKQQDNAIMKQKIIKTLEDNMKSVDALTLKMSQDNLNLVNKLAALQQRLQDKNKEIQTLLNCIKTKEEKGKHIQDQLNQTIVQMDCLKQFVQGKEALISQLNQKLIRMGEKLQEFQAAQNNSQKQQKQQNKQIPLLNSQLPFSDQPATAPFSPRQSVQSLIQQLQSKDDQIQELSTQLKESFEIIKVLKSELEERENQFMIYQQEQEASREQTNSNRWESGQVEDKQEGHADEGCEYQHHQSNVHSQEAHLWRVYLAKIQAHYNEVLEVFGLELVSFDLMHSSKLQQIKPLNTKLPARSDSLNSQQSILNDTHQNQPQDHISTPEKKPASSQELPTYHTPPFESLLDLLSSTQEEVLHTINQWIRKLQRQSLSIHQGKEKIHFMERQIKDLQHQNQLLDMEKHQICDKYETFIAKLQLQNGIFEEKNDLITQKLTDIQTYVKELQQLIKQTNKQCLKTSLYALQLAKQHENRNLKPLYFSPQEFSVKEKDKLVKQSELLIEGGKNVTHHTCLEYLNRKLMRECTQTKESKSYWAQFYERHGQGNPLENILAGNKTGQKGSNGAIYQIELRGSASEQLPTEYNLPQTILDDEPNSRKQQIPMIGQVQ